MLCGCKYMNIQIIGFQVLFLKNYSALSLMNGTA